MSGFVMFLIFAILLLQTAVESCKVRTGRQPIEKTSELFRLSRLLVYGRTTRFIQVPNNGSMFPASVYPYTTDAVFKVYCLLKNDDAIKVDPMITLKRIKPMTSCDRTELNLNEDIILALEETPSGLRFDEVDGPFRGASYVANEENLALGVQAGRDGLARLPAGGDPNDKPGCPVVNAKPEVRKVLYKNRGMIMSGSASGYYASFTKFQLVTVSLVLILFSLRL